MKAEHAKLDGYRATLPVMRPSPRPPTVVAPPPLALAPPPARLHDSGRLIPPTKPVPLLLCALARMGRGSAKIRYRLRKMHKYILESEVELRLYRLS